MNLAPSGSVIFTVCCSLCAAALVAAGLLHKRHRRTARKPYPPGPQETSYILGNLSDLPKPPAEWNQFHELSKIYGPVLHMRALDRHIVVLDTFQAAVDLLEKRGANYSDRPRMPMVGELMGYGWHLTIMRYGDGWRLHRRALHQHLHEGALTRLYPNLERMNSRFLRALIHTPGEWWALTHWLAGANILSMVYGMEDTQLADDPWIALGDAALQMANDAFVSGYQVVDIFPILKYIPAWFPGAGFKRKARRAHAVSMRTRDEPLEWLRAQMAAGTAAPSIAASLIDTELDGAPLLEEVVANCAGVAYVAGVDTALSTMRAFFLAMVRNPEAQRKAQEELDRVLPGDRIPTLSDRGAFPMPYLEAVLRETYRLYPPAPLGVPHRAIEEDEYDGMRIPAGTVLIANIWSMMRDGKTFGAEPLSFRPERFLKKDGHIDRNVMDPRAAVFGFGRRVCPGRHLADSEVWLMMVTVLYAFDIMPAQDDLRRDILPTEEVTGAFVVAPKQFGCRIAPRSEARKALILDALSA